MTLKLPRITPSFTYFTGSPQEDLNGWIQQFSAWQGSSDPGLLHLAGNYLWGYAREWFTLQLPNLKTFADLTLALTAAFPNNLDTTRYITDFYARKCIPGDSPVNYVRTMELLARRAGIPDEYAIPVVISTGLPQDFSRSLSLIRESPPKTFTELVTAVERLYRCSPYQPIPITSAVVPFSGLGITGLQTASWPWLQQPYTNFQQPYTNLQQPYTNLQHPYPNPQPPAFSLAPPPTNPHPTTFPLPPMPIHSYPQGQHPVLSVVPPPPVSAQHAPDHNTRSTACRGCRATLLPETTHCRYCHTNDHQIPDCPQLAKKQGRRPTPRPTFTSNFTSIGPVNALETAIDVNAGAFDHNKRRAVDFPPKYQPSQNTPFSIVKELSTLKPSISCLDLLKISPQASSELLSFLNPSTNPNTVTANTTTTQEPNSYKAKGGGYVRILAAIDNSNCSSDRYGFANIRNLPLRG